MRMKWWTDTLRHRSKIRQRFSGKARTEDNWRVGLELMKKAGAVITSTETIIFQILKIAGTEEFKEMLKIIK